MLYSTISSDNVERGKPKKRGVLEEEAESPHNRNGYSCHSQEDKLGRRAKVVESRTVG